MIIIATSIEECVACVKAWKEGMESKGLHMNMTKTKIMASGLDLDVLRDSDKFPCAVCRTGVGERAALCALLATTGFTRSVVVLRLSR